MYYRKKPVVIEAFMVDYESDRSKIDYPDWFFAAMKRGYIDYEDGKYHIKTLEGVMTVSHRDYVIKGIQGEIYPCKPDIFLDSYEQVSDNPT